ncbi:MAG: adenylate/guanylate cyclase domain-containing protein [Burkholderiaceae bacterium]|nr:adenylate/guanylate cyclase domain-containing protein [Burkholderiaceae bacterium]
MPSEPQQLEHAIAAFEAQRPLLGEAMVDMAVAPLKAKLAALLGTAVTPTPEPAQALKQVSILFLDVVGSTTLSQHLDPEAISAVMDDALSRGTTVVQAHRGKVLQYAGDNILAAFGADEAREDDAERAVHCGLALLALGNTLGGEVRAAHHHAGFNVRVGIHTGGVLLGGGVDADGSIRGIAVNIAARMEQTAPTGALRISQDTYAQVRGLFEVDVQEPLAVKGVDAPVQSYLVNRPKPRQFRIGTRGIEGVATKMIGRDAELELLQTAFKRLFTDRQLAAVTVVAEAGIGKSRLLYEFEAWSETRPESFFLFRGRATPATGTQAFGLLRDVLAWRFQINDDDSIEAARKKMEDGIVPLFLHDDGPDLAEGHAHLLGHLIGIEWRDSRHIKGILDDPKQIRNRAFHAAAQLFRRVSASDVSTSGIRAGDTSASEINANDGDPIVLQLDDLHWADNESLDFLNYLAEVNRDVPLLVLSFTRGTLYERKTDWLIGEGRTQGIHQRIDLQPLNKGDSRELANELLKKLPEVPAALRELLISSAEGNPFYMEELLKMLIDQGAIQTGEAWQVNAQQLLVIKVPPTLTGVLQARLDGLPAAEKRALQQASVVGAVFWDQALAAVEAQAAAQLPALVQRELTLPRLDAPIDGLREYAFKHQVLHQVTYDTVLKRHKREGHARVAQWLAGLTEQGSLRGGDFLGLAAEHYEWAGDGGNAAEFHARAAEQAGARLAHERVLAHVRRALALLGDAPVAQDAQDSQSAKPPQAAQAAPPAHAELRWRLLGVREKSLYVQARRDEQAADLAALAQLADGLDDDRRRAEVAQRRGLRALRMADWATLESAARHCMACATRAGDDGLRLSALRLLAIAQMSQGDIDAGRALALKSLAEARGLGLREVEARLLNVLSVAANMQGDLLGLLDFGRQCLPIFRETGDRVNEAIGLANLGASWLGLGDLPQARRELDGALQLLRANGDRVVEGSTLSHLSALALWQGDETRALALARASLEIAVATQARDDEVVAGLALGNSELALGRTAAARLAFTQAPAVGLQMDDPKQHEASAGLARVALAEGDTAAALAALQPLLDHSAAGGTLDGTEYPRQVELTCHQALARAGDPRAADWLASAHTALMAQADAIGQSSGGAALRQMFLTNIPHHREIVALWEAHGAQ